MSESATNLPAALCAFHADVNKIHKEARGNFGHYADLATVLSAVLPALSKNGLAVTQTFMPGAEAGDQLLVTSLLHTSGERVESHLPLIISKGRNPLHDWGGATTYARRYALLAILSLAAGIEDDDGESGVPQPSTVKTSPTPAQPQKPVAKAKEQPVANEAKPLDQATRKEVLSVLGKIAKEQPEAFKKFDAEYRKRFSLDADTLIRDHFNEEAHNQLAQAFIKSLEQK